MHTCCKHISLSRLQLCRPFSRLCGRPPTLRRLQQVSTAPPHEQIILRPQASAPRHTSHIATAHCPRLTGHDPRHTNLTLTTIISNPQHTTNHNQRPTTRDPRVHSTQPAASSPPPAYDTLTTKFVRRTAHGTKSLAKVHRPVSFC